MGSKVKYLVRKRALGDVLWIEPIIEQLAKQHKKLIVHTKYNQLFENYPLKNVIFKNELSFLEKLLVRAGKFPLINKLVTNLDDCYEQSPKQPLLCAYQQKALVEYREDYPRLFLSDEEKRMFNSLKEKGAYTILHVDNKALKNFRKAYGINWQKIVQLLNEKGKNVYLIGAEDPKIIGATFIPTTIREMIALIYKADLFIGVDSGPSHIAASLQIPALLFFGAVNPNFRHFRNLFKGVIMQQPCIYAGCFHEFKTPDEVVCRIVGDTGIPPCCSFTTGQVKDSINLLIEKYS